MTNEDSMEKVLTIVVPTYNMEKYLRKCLDSLIVPNMDKVEVLVINDGSKDSSSAIAHEYQNKYPQTFRVIDKENGNYGSCINRGIKEATGKYIKILDADDWFDSNNFSSFISRLASVDADIVLTNFKIVNRRRNGDSISETDYRNIYPNMPVNRQFDFVKFLNSDKTYYAHMHAFTYRLQLLRDMGYHQTEGISYTDQEWVFIPVSHVKTCQYIPISVYCYLIGREGQTMQNMDRHILQLMAVTKSLIRYYEDNKGTNLNKYYTSQIVVQLKYIFNEGLLNEAFPMEILRSYEGYLSHHSYFYDAINTIKCARIPYVKIWIDGNRRRLPLTIRNYIKARVFLSNVKEKLKMSKN